MEIHCITLFPEIFPGPLGVSVLQRALDQKLVQLNTVQLRDFAKDKHRTVDDIPYGGGAGMVMKPEPIFEAVASIPAKPSRAVIYPSPQGKVFTQGMAKQLAEKEQLIFICGRYEGVDQRVIDHLVTHEISIGEYVLTGGELPAMIMIDTIMRQIPGVVGKQESVENDSFQEGELDYPAYTRPERYQDWEVPSVLLSGHHGEIEKWRKTQARDKMNRLKNEK